MQHEHLRDQDIMHSARMHYSHMHWWVVLL